MDVEYQGDGGDDARKTSFKSRRTVKEKYVRNACGQCRKAKAKCNGLKPVCERCQKTGHECNWSNEDARRPLTRDHERALKNQNAILRAEVDRLAREVAALRMQVGCSTSESGTLAEGPSDSGSPSLNAVPPSSFPDGPPNSLSGASLLPLSPTAVSSYSQRRQAQQQAQSSMAKIGSGTWGNLPVDDLGGDANNFGRGVSDSEGVDGNSELDSGGSESTDDDSDEDLDQALAGPTKTLFNEHDDLHHYGLTSVFRLRKQASLAKIRYTSLEYDSVSSSPERPLRPHRDISRRQSDSHHTSTTTHQAPRRQRGRRPARNLATRQSSPDRTRRHVLLLDDQDGNNVKGCDCQSECWNRWLPKCAPLTRREHDTLLDRLFMFFTSWCMRAIPDYFLRDMYTYLHPPPSSSSAALPKLNHYSPLLHNCMLAVATAFSSNPEIRNPETRAKFAEKAKGYIEVECSRPNISTVQALGLFASYYSGQGQQTLGFMYFGMSARIAQALGLCADCAPLLRSGRLKPSQVLDRAWAYHMGIAQDACWSLYVGRECGFSVQLPTPLCKPNSYDPALNANPEALTNSKGSAMGVNAGIQENTSAPHTSFPMDDPLNLSTMSVAALERLDLLTWRGNGDGKEYPNNKMFSAFMRTCQIMKISRLVMDLMNRLASANNGTEIKLMVAEIDIQLDHWKQDLPPELRLTPSNERHAYPHKLMMHAAFYWQRILLHRPFYQRHRAQFVDSGFSVARCDVAAKEIVHILRLWREIYGTVRYAPVTLIQAIFAAGTVYILQSIQASEGRRHAVSSQATALEHLEELIGYLRECEQSWECASRIADTFEKLHKEHRRAMEQGLALTRKKSRRRRGRSGAVGTGQGEGEKGPQSSEANASHDKTVAGTPAGSRLLLHPISEHILGEGLSPTNSSLGSASHTSLQPLSAVEATSSRAPPFEFNNRGASYPELTNAQQPCYPSGALAVPASASIFSDSSYASASDLEVDIDPDLQSPGGGPSSAVGMDGDTHMNFESLFGDVGNFMDMDVVMPGMRLIDPTSLAFNSLNSHGSFGYSNAGGNLMHVGEGFSGYGSSDWAQVQGNVGASEGRAPEMGSAGLVAGTQSEMDFMSDGEYDQGALLEILAVLNDASQGTFG